MTRCGFVALLGLPNAGKSTLLNALLGEKLSIVCHKRQTTRRRIVGILTKNKAQAILMDTPGIFFNAQGAFERSMVSTAWKSVEEAALALLIVDAHKPSFFEDTKKILLQLKRVEDKLILVLNKIDLLKEKKQLLETIKDFGKDVSPSSVFMISAQKKSGLKELESHILNTLPQGPWIYPEDQLSNLSERFLSEEITREVLLHQLHDEIPHGLVVITEKWEDFTNGDIKIFQQIRLEKKSHKAIVLGKNGSKIKMMGEKARASLSRFLGCKVHLQLYVIVDETWKANPEFYQNLEMKP